jgi:hypothetical protein
MSFLLRSRRCAAYRCAGLELHQSPDVAVAGFKAMNGRVFFGCDGDSDGVNRVMEIRPESDVIARGKLLCDACSSHLSGPNVGCHNTGEMHFKSESRRV